MAIETNELIDVQTLPPFKKFIMSIGAIPTSYLDSMSYAELLAWFCNYLQNTVIPTVNNNGEAVEELQDLFVELKDYVDNYFNNLNVQHEINNKLDSMAQDGTLTQLISAYIDPYITEQNANILAIDTRTAGQVLTLQNQINALSSGSPLVASSTAGMTNTSKVYVNTTDGKWYYYDGDSWEIGGTYQSTQLVTDTTLSESGEPADGRATGSAIKELNYIYDLEQGSLNASGQESASNIRLRSGFFTSDKPLSLVADDGYQFAIYFYNLDGSFIEYYAYQTKRFLPVSSTKKYRLVVKKSTDATITPAYSDSYMTIYEQDMTNNFALNLGTINSSGVDQSAENRCRTGYLDITEDIIIKAKSGYSFSIYTYQSDNTFINYIPYTTESYVKYDTTKKYRLLLKNSSNTYFIPTITSDYLDITDAKIHNINLLKNQSFNSPKGIFGIMTYNVGQWYNGSGNIVPDEKANTYLNLQNGIISRYQADILCTQEVTNSFNSSLSTPAFLSQYYQNTVLEKGGTTYHGKSISSNMPILNAENVNFTVGTGRNYEKAYIYLNGKKVLVISVHFSLDENEIDSEITELLSAIDEEEYVIICGDMNCNGDSTLIGRFRNAGYKTANDGSLITYPETSKSLDNIIVTSNFDIQYSIVDEQKEDNPDGEDHYPLITYLIIK